MAGEVAAALVGASIAAGVETIRTVGSVLTSDRSVIIEVDNNADLTLTKIAHDHRSGGFATLPNLTIPPHSFNVFGAQKKGLALATGTIGSVTYAADGLEMMIGWHNAFAGENFTTVGPENSGLGGPNANRFLAIHQTGVGNTEAHMRFMLFVHPPYSLKDAFKDKGDLSQGIFRVLGMHPGDGIRDQLPNTTAIDLT